MPNQLAIPFKRTYTPPIRQATRDYLLEHGDTHPDTVKWDINQWEALRKNGVGGTVHVNRIDATISYHAQLVFILTKLPNDINLEISYATAFAPSAIPIGLRDLMFERACVLFNLAALYSQLAGAEDRSNPQGVKRAKVYFESAAGTLSYLNTSVLPKFSLPDSEEDRPLDLTEPFIKSLELLMLAQAQECVWQRAVMDSMKNGVIAKLATQVSIYYSHAATTIQEASPDIREIFPPHWLPHLQAKEHHFSAAAQYRKSVDELEANEYGVELARLGQAQEDAKKGYNIARRGGVAEDVLKDSILDNVEKNITRAERDNDLIYHQDVPAVSSLPLIGAAPIAKSNVPPGLANPQHALGDQQAIFGDVLAAGARSAIDIYNHNKQALIEEKITEFVNELDAECDETLRVLKLPSALDALEKSVGLPTSLLKKAEEVRLEDGPAKIEKFIEDVERLAVHVSNILDEAMDILDNEASEDEAARKSGLIDRPFSHDANKHLVEKERRYRDVVRQAKDSDALVVDKWEQWEKNITDLTLDPDELEELIPSTAVPFSSRPKSANAETQSHARALRVLLESLDDLRTARASLVERADRLSEADDIQPRILKAAAGIERWAEVQPVMFEDIMDEEMAKYDKFIKGVSQNGEKQETMLEEIRSRNEAFLSSRKDDPSIKEREHALQSLDLAYHKYREISHNLDEGLHFYNDLAGILQQFKESCQVWAHTRQLEIQSLHQSMQSMSLQDVTTEPERPQPNVNPTPRKSGKAPLKAPLPSLKSDEWESLELPPGPPPKTKSRTPRHAVPQA
ncbi:hypothetical protein PLICRDRAFT_159226 [Plicaturopsis crispa FD-325 SS-3]|nr:hypothetical protein PLICRDRAFT_159226 [Plicaturopsis crispa FD-325 SS-3]